jgi:adenine-specific DNA glycosylase
MGVRAWTAAKTEVETEAGIGAGAAKPGGSGAEVCKRSAPRCEVCPLTRLCAWYAERASSS